MLFIKFDDHVLCDQPVHGLSQIRPHTQVTYQDRRLLN